MNYAQFRKHIEAKNNELENKLDLVVRFMQERPQISRFSEQILEKMFDKVKVKDHVVWRGEHKILEPMTTRYIPKTPKKIRVLKDKSSVPLREAYKETNKKSKSKTPIKKSKPWIEYQIGGRVPTDLTIRRIEPSMLEDDDRKVCVT